MKDASWSDDGCVLPVKKINSQIFKVKENIFLSTYIFHCSRNFLKNTIRKPVPLCTELIL